MNKKKAETLIEGIRELIRAECSAGFMLVEGDQDGFKMFDELAAEVAKELVDQLTTTET